MSRLLILLALAAMSSACWVHHSALNAPGEVDISEEPEDFAVGQRQWPEDPGQHVVSLLTGPFLTIGAEDGVERVQFGGEVTLMYNERERSQVRDFPAFLLLGDGLSWGGNVGWSFYQLHSYDDTVDPSMGALYVEGQVRLPIPVVAAGWAVEPGSGRTGPQATISPFGMNWFRVNYNTDGTWALMYGVTAKLSNVWVWSR